VHPQDDPRRNAYQTSRAHLLQCQPGPCPTESKAAVPRLRPHSSAEGRPHERGDSRMDRPGRIVTPLFEFSVALRAPRVRGTLWPGRAVAVSAASSCEPIPRAYRVGAYRERIVCGSHPPFRSRAADAFSASAATVCRTFQRSGSVPCAAGRATLLAVKRTQATELRLSVSRPKGDK
jgi:hypothetical protein